MDLSCFQKAQSVYEIPRLNSLQEQSYREFLQAECPPGDRVHRGLEEIFKETFPIESHDKAVTLEYVSYRIDPPIRTPENCKALGMTYGRPFRIKVRCRMEGKDPIEEEIHVGEIPEMVGGGEFIVNGVERVIVIQIQRSPGVDFEAGAGGKKSHTARIIPERGSWIELEINSKDVLFMRIDKSSKLPATTLLRALAESPDGATDRGVLSHFYEMVDVDISDMTKAQVKKALTGTVLVDGIKNPDYSIEEPDSKQEEYLIAPLTTIKDSMADNIMKNSNGTVTVIPSVKDPLILETVRQEHREGFIGSQEDIQLHLYHRLRPSTPGSIERAKELIYDRFQNSAFYSFGAVGRFRMNRKFDLNIPEDQVDLKADDLISIYKHFFKLRARSAEPDDIDHLGNRRIRTISDLLSGEFRSGLYKMKRTIADKINLKQLQADQSGADDLITPRTLINTQPINSAIDYFFSRGELSQVVDQTNPLSQLIHERRLSALGPGGLSRRHAGFEVRDVHTSHYGRICAIQTPEGANIGLIMQLSLYARINEYGFLVTPYRVVKNGVVTDEVVELMADEESDKNIIPGDAPMDGKKIIGDMVLVRRKGDYISVPVGMVDYMDVSTQQTVGLAASLIPFLEHDDANRALMGSNMQGQAVPLMNTEVPVVGTGMEKEVAKHSSVCLKSNTDGVVTYVDCKRIVINDVEYNLEKLKLLNSKTSQNHKPIVRPGDRVKAGDIIADGASMRNGELALGRNVLVGFLSWKGHNFEDAVIVSKELVMQDAFTSVHIVEQTTTVRETKLGQEEITRDIANVSDQALAHLDEDGLVVIGTYVKPGDILVGKISPKSKSELSSEERLMQAIFGRAGQDVKNDSLTVKPGVEGYVVDVKRFRRKTMLNDQQKAENRKQIRQVKQFYLEKICEEIKAKKEILTEIFGDTLYHKHSKYPYRLDLSDDEPVLISFHESFDLDQFDVDEKKRALAEKRMFEHNQNIAVYGNRRSIEEENIKRGDYLPFGVLEKASVYIAQKYTLAVGDKMAGRHGNKGVISQLLPVEDMPYLDDGTPLQMILNPLGVPSRMNYGQILETHLGWAMKKLGTVARCPVFDSNTEEDVVSALEEAGLPKNGKARLTDGITGEKFDQETTVGQIYMLKLHHLVRDKLHARSTGPYSLITQQPLGGKARMGGQRLGEMEVWALEAHGAATALQEFLTVKSDDITGRSKIFKSIVSESKGEKNKLNPGMPQSLSVLLNEIKGLCLNIRLNKKVQPMADSMEDFR